MSSPDALTRAEAPDAASLRVQHLRRALEEEGERRRLVAEFVEHHMKREVDYGTIPGAPKPTLLKPGAEKLVDILRCTPKFKLMKAEEDFARGFFNYMFRVQLVSRDAKEVLAEGYGSANSHEARYRWRNANRKCPKCGKEAIHKSRDGGWFCWKKKDGCGASFADEDPVIAGQVAGKVENENVADLANTILKMAKKRALVDGAIALGRCSDLFDQDREDLEEADALASEPRTPPAGREPRREAPPPRTAPPPAAVPPPSAEERTLGKLRQDTWALIKQAGCEPAGLRSWAERVLGAPKPSKEWTAEDCARLQDDARACLKQAVGAAP